MRSSLLKTFQCQFSVSSSALNPRGKVESLLSGGQDGRRRDNRFQALTKLIDLNGKKKKKVFYDDITEFPAAAEKFRGGNRPMYVKSSSIEKAKNVFRAREHSYPFAKIKPPDPRMLQLARQQKFMDKASQSEIISGFLDLESSSEILQMWKTIACISTTDCLDWNSCEVEAAIDVVSSTAMEFSWEQLKTAVHYLSFVHRYDPPQPRTLHKLKNALDHACTLRLQGLVKDTRRNPTTKPLYEDNIRHECLYLAYLWFKVGLITDYDANHLKGWHCRYSRMLIDFLLEPECLAQLSKEEFVFVMFLMGLQRYCPGADHLPRVRDDRGFALPENIERKCLEVFDDLSLDEIGIVCHAFHQSHIAIRTKNSAFKDKVFTALLTIDNSKVLTSEMAIATITKLLKHRGSVDSAIVSKFMDKYSQLLPNFIMLTKIRILNFIISGCPMNSQPFLAQFVDSIRHDLRGLRLKDLEQIAFSLYFLNYREDHVSPDIYATLAAAADSCDRADPRSGRSQVFLLTFLSKMGVFEAEEIDSLFRKVNSYKPFLERNSDNDCLLKHGVDFLFSLREPKIGSVPQAMHQREIGPSKTMNSNALWHIAELDCNIAIEANDYKGERLNPVIRNRFLDLISYETDNSRAEKMRQMMYSDLEDLFKENLYYGPTLPHSTYSDFMLCFDRRGRTLPIRDNFSRDIVRPDPAVGDWIVLVAPKRGNFGVGGVPRGPVVYKVRQLKELGYKVILLRHYAYLKSRDAGKSQRFLANLIHRELKSK